MSVKSQSLLSVQEHYSSLVHNSDSILPKSVNSKAQSIFQRAGFPTHRHEDWKYTSLDKLYTADTISHHLANEYSMEGLPIENARNVIIISAMEQTIHGDVPEGLHIDFLHNVADIEKNALNSQLIAGNQALSELLPDDPMLAINQCSCTLLISIRVDNKALIETPIVIDYGNGVEITHPYPQLKSVQVMVSLGQSSQASILEYHRNGVSQQELSLISSFFFLDENAQCQHFSLSNHQLSNQKFWYGYGSIAKDAHLQSNAFITGEQLVRRFFCSDLVGKGAQSTVNSAYRAKGSQTIDVRTLTRHMQAHCQSVQLHQGLLDDQANGVFNGLIYVHPEALQTDGQMDNNVILLAPTAQNNSKPQLEIYADDVKCSHGFTCGTIDQNQLYYMRSRGIPENLARKHILKAFIARVTENFPDYVQLDVL